MPMLKGKRVFINVSALTGGKEGATTTGNGDLGGQVVIAEEGDILTLKSEPLPTFETVEGAKGKKQRLVHKPHTGTWTRDQVWQPDARTEFEIDGQHYRIRTESD